MLEESIDVGGEKDNNRDHDTVIDDSAIDFFTDNESALTTPTGRSPPESILSPGPEDEEVAESGGNVANNNINNNGATGTSALDRRSVSERIKNITAASKNSRAVAVTNIATKPDTTTTKVPATVAAAKTTAITKPVVARKMNIVRVALPSSKVEKVEKLEQRSKRFGAPTSEEEKKKQRLGRFSASATTTTPAPSSSCNATAPATVVGPGTEKVSTATATTTKATKLVRGSAADRLAERQARFADTTLKKRQERFGVVTSRSLNLTTDMKTRKLMRAQKFGTVA